MNLRTIRKRGLALLLAGVMTVGLAPAALATDGTPLESGLLTEPFLQVPGETSVNVVWFTEGDQAPTTNQVLLYENGQDQAPTRTIDAETTQLSRGPGRKNHRGLQRPHRPANHLASRGRGHRPAGVPRSGRGERSPTGWLATGLRARSTPSRPRPRRGLP